MLISFFRGINVVGQFFIFNSYRNFVVVKLDNPESSPGLLLLVGT